MSGAPSPGQTGWIHCETQPNRAENEPWGTAPRGPALILHLIINLILVGNKMTPRLGDGADYCRGSESDTQECTSMDEVLTDIVNGCRKRLAQQLSSAGHGPWRSATDIIKSGLAAL